MMGIEWSIRLKRIKKAYGPRKETGVFVTARQGARKAELRLASYDARTGIVDEAWKVLAPMR
jgi:hypothetical protein